MTRQVRDSKLEVRNNRRKLDIQSKPYWKAMDQGLHIGYRKHSSGGTWVARRLNEQKRYREERLGMADDLQDADGLEVLNFSQAQEKARQWFHAEIRKEHGVEDIVKGKYTVADAIREYLANYAIEGKGLATTQASINAHILPELGTIELTRLTTKKITNWHQTLANAPARLRTSKTTKKQNIRALSNDPDIVRRRRATANRVLTMLKAALNYAWKEGKVADDTAWRKAKPFRNVDAAKIRYLTKEEGVRLVNACAPDFRKLVKAALFTGCRYSELTDLTVADFNAMAGTIFIKQSKNGKQRYVMLDEIGEEFFVSITTGKLGEELIFSHENGDVWGKSHQKRRIINACSIAKIEPAISFHILRHTHAAMLAMQGVEMPIIAQQLGHSGTRTTEKHYAHLSPNYIKHTIRQNFPKLAFAEDNKVAAFTAKKSKVVL